MPRADDLQRLSRAEPWDVLVVGGGATGLGVAYQAAQRGWRVALLEAHDFASGTSSRSTKLLHGGVRYLAQGHWALVLNYVAVQALPGAGRALGLGLSEAMVRYAVRFEWALTVEDVLARRWRALFLDAAQAGQMVPSVARIMREEHAASGQAGLDVEQDAFVALTQRYLLASKPTLKA